MFIVLQRQKQELLLSLNGIDEANANKMKILTQKWMENKSLVDDLWVIFIGILQKMNAC